jgi:endo-1,4-beta-D-glucanase Y
MLRSKLSSRSMAVLAAGFLAAQSMACTPSASSGSGGSSSGSGGNGSGGSSSGSGGSSSGSGGKVGSGGSASGGNASGGSSSGSGGSSSGSGGSSTGSGGSTTGSGGSSTGSGGSTTGSGGSSTGSGGSSTGSGGSSTGSGGSGTGSGGSGTGSGGSGVGGAIEGRACAPASSDVISDFEEGYGVMVKQGGRTGFWRTYNNTADPQNQTPANPMGTMADKIAVEPAGACMMSAFHSSATGQDNYVGFGAAFKPATPLTEPLNKKNMTYDVSAWDGISFKAKTGGGPTSQPVFVEILTAETQPADSGGTAMLQAIDLYNNRGFIANVASTTYQTFYVPFGAMIPRSLPAAGSGTNTCPAAGANVPKCQAPKFVAANALGIQFSFYGPMDTPGFPNPSPVGSYNLFIDDVTFYKRSATTVDLPALPSSGGAHPLQDNPTLKNGCAKPANANGKLLGLAYDNWKKRFVVAASGGFRVQRPENSNDSVSEGIAYGMLIAVYMDDKALFDGLYTYWKANTTGGPLMTWKVPGGTGTATDADEDAAFALLMASKQWSGGSYASEAMKLMDAVRAQDMSGSNYIKGGSNYSASDVTNPSYFAPAWYRAFARADAANAATWNGLASAAYTLLGAIGGTSSNGLYAAWCGSNCTTIAQNTGSADPATDKLYQYDSHRIPWRFGMDYCMNGTAAGKAYTDKTSAFFSSTSRGGGGVGRIFDQYNPNGTDVTGASVNSASIIGTAAAGAMGNSTYSGFVADGYQLVLDELNRGEIGDRLATAMSVKSAYSYYNATVGMLMLLTMSGNIQDWTQ